jgi:hypothetical protein
MATNSESAVLRTSQEVMAELQKDPANARHLFAPIAEAAGRDAAIRERIQDHRRFITIVAAEAWSDS